MCLASADINDMIAVLVDLRDARNLVEDMNQPGLVQVDDSFLETVSVEEAQHIAKRRVERLEARAKELGVFGPSPKADPAEQVRIAASR
jgi:hypothetical protein